MTTGEKQSVPLTTEQEVVAARQLVRRTMQQMEFSLVEQTKFVTAASELARNAVKYGGGGEMHLEVVQDGARRGIRLVFSDDGPGIPDLEQAMTDGWTTGAGLGMGLSGARRLVGEFAVETAVGKGTRVTIARWK